MRLNVLFVIASLMLFAVGCGGENQTMTEAEKEASKAKMESDMQQMMGSIPQKPGEGQPEPAAPAAAPESE